MGVTGNLAASMKPSESEFEIRIERTNVIRGERERRRSRGAAVPRRHNHSSVYRSLCTATVLSVSHYSPDTNLYPIRDHGPTAECCYCASAYVNCEFD